MQQDRRALLNRDVSKPAQPVLIRGARQVITFHSSGGPLRGSHARNLHVIPDGSVLIADGLISHIGPTRRLENLNEAQNAVEIDATGRIILPAFIDPRMDIIRHSPETRSSPTTAFVRNLQNGTERALRRAVRHGTIAMDLRARLSGKSTPDYRLIRILSSVADYSGASAICSVELEAEPDRITTSLIRSLREEVLPRLHAKDQLAFGAITIDGGLRDLALVAELADAFRSHGLGLKIAVDGVSHSGHLPAALSLAPICVEGLNNSTPDELDALVRTDVIAVLMPAFSFGDGHLSYPKARRILDGGGAIALASGFQPGLPNVTLSMQTVLALACRDMGMTIEEALTSVTINAACANGLDASAGSLQRGKLADILILDVPDYRELEKQFGANLTYAVVKNGRVIYREADLDWLSAS